MLHTAVMSSSSCREFCDLVGEIGQVSGANRFDLLMLRACDIGAIGLNVGSGGRMSQVLADDSHIPLIRDWLLKEMSDFDVTVPALATYFPDISSADNARRRTAVHALANTVLLAFELGQLMPQKIVEFVCGSIPEPGDKGIVHVHGAARKLDILCASLQEVVQLVRAKHPPGDSASFALAAELEPGETYVVNSSRRLTELFERIDRAAGGFGRLRDYVGLNVDIAHMRIANVPAPELKPLQDRIVHAHVSDHPGMHTHDQYVGSWTYPHHLRDGYIPYLRLLLDRATQVSDQPDAPALPFSRSVAIELEGANEIFSVHDSISRMRHLIAFTETR